MLKKRVVLIYLFVFMIANIFASEKKNMLWEITSFANNKVYVLGSIHAAPDDIFPLDKIVEEKYSECSQIAVESDISKNLSEEVQDYISQEAFYRTGSIADHISVKIKADLIKSLDNFGLDYEIFKKYKPWYIIMNLEALMIKQAGLEFEKGIDLHFINKAKKDNKEILELEGLLEQLKFLIDLPDTTQISFLEFTLRDKNDYKNELQEIILAWKSGNTKLLGKIIFRAFNQNVMTKHLYKILVYERNILMADKIEGFIQSEENTFVVAGIAHFVGKDSVLQILRKRGYFIKRL